MSVVNILDLVKLVRLRLVELVHQICERLHLSPRKFSSKLHYKRAAKVIGEVSPFRYLCMLRNINIS